MTIPSNSSLSSVVVPTMLLIEVLLLAILPTSTYGEICTGIAASPNWYGSAAYPPYFTRNTAEKCVQKYALSRCEQSAVMKDGGSNFTVNSATGEEVCTATVDCLPTKQNCNDTLVCSDLVKLKDELMEGGHNIVCRHEKTYWSQYTGEAKNCHLHQNCLDSAVKLTQRQLQPLGYKSAKHFANAFIQMGVPIGKTYSSPFTRCAEHAQVFSQEPNEERLELLYMSIWEEILALQNITSLVKVNALKWQAYNMRNFAGKKPAPGKNNIMITHGFNIKLAFGTAVDEGYCMVLKPEDTLPSLADSIGSLTVGNRQFIFDNDSFPVDAIARMSPESALLMQTCDDVRTDAIKNDDGALATIDADHDMKISREEFISAHNDYDDDKGATSDQAYDAFDFISSVIVQPELFGYYKSSSSPSIELGQFFHINWGWREYLKTGGDISYPWRSIIENTIGSLGNNSPESRVASFKQANSILSNLIIALRDQTAYPSKVYMESKLINCDANFIAEYAISNCAAQVSSHHGGAFDYIPIGPGDGGSGTLDGEFIFDLPLAYPSQWTPEKSHFVDNRLLKVATCLVHEEFITLEDTLELMGCSVGQKQHDNQDEDEDTACATEHENAMTCGSRNGSSQCCDGLTCHSHASTCVKEEDKTCASVNMLAKECGSTNSVSSPECCSGLTCDYVTSKCTSSPDNDDESHSASLTDSPTYTPIGIGI